MDIRVVIFLTIIFGGIEALICKTFKKKFVKYVLPITLLVISLILILIGKFAPLEGMRDLAYLVTGTLAGISSVISFIVAFACNYLYKDEKKT